MSHFFGFVANSDARECVPTIQEVVLLVRPTHLNALRREFIFTGPRSPRGSQRWVSPGRRHRSVSSIHAWTGTRSGRSWAIVSRRVTWVAMDHTRGLSSESLTRQSLLSLLLGPRGHAGLRLGVEAEVQDARRGREGEVPGRLPVLPLASLARRRRGLVEETPVHVPLPLHPVGEISPRGTVRHPPSLRALSRAHPARRVPRDSSERAAHVRSDSKRRACVRRAGRSVVRTVGPTLKLSLQTSHKGTRDSSMSM